MHDPRGHHDAGGTSVVHQPIAGCAIPGTPLARAASGLDACVHCGFCLQACPTYVNLEDENESPRGRLVLMSRLLEGDIALDDADAGKHLDRCLGCRACETACPSGVPYGELLEATRATMATVRGRPFIARVVLAVFAHTALLRMALVVARVARDTRIPRALARVLPERLAFPLAMLASTAPLSLRSARNTSARTPFAAPRPETDAHTAAAVPTAVLSGCVMSGLFGHVNAATGRVLAHNGYAVCTTPNQHCCGALHAHAGDLEGARALARRNIAAFEASNVDLIAVNSAGCGAMLKQYGHLLHDDPVWAERAERIGAKTRDVSELLAATGPRRGRVPPVRVTHDPPCHQMHAQRVVSQPLAVLQAIDGIELLPLEDADQCCGSAGIYNLIEPATSDAVLAPKLAAIARTGAALVATGNPGCMMQIGAGLLRSGSAARVVHPVELLDAGYGGGGG
jgi:glycolate oxidase iron-sulfur subunit